MTVDDVPCLPVLKNIATRLRIESIRATTEAGEWASDDVHVGRGPGGGAVLRRDALRPADPQHPARRSLRAVEGPRRAAALRGLGRSRVHPARATCSTLRQFTSDLEGHPDAAAAVRGRRHRLARPGPVRRRRHGAERAPHRQRLPHLRADGRRRERRRLGVGSRRGGAVLRASTTLVRHHRRERARPEPRAPSSSTTSASFARRWQAFGWHAIVIDGHDMAQILAAFAEARAHDGPADDDPGAHAQGPGRELPGRASRTGTARRSRRATS